MKKDRVVVECKQCGKTFLVPECRVWRSNYCSANCRISAREDRYKVRQVVCSVCKETFTPRTTQIRAGIGKFCSHKCKGVAFSGAGNPFFGKTHTKQEVDRWRVAMENNGSWKYGDNHHGYKGGFIFRGYRILSVSGKIIPEHRLVAGATNPG